MEFAQFIDKHHGENIIVYGLSPQSVNLISDEDVFYRVTIGVNDILRYKAVDYVVCVDEKSCFTEERWKYIEDTDIIGSIIFSQLELPVKNLCKIKVGTFDSGLLSPQIIETGYTSVHVAIVIAYWMGAAKIGLLGCDMTDPGHALYPSRDNIKSEFIKLKQKLAVKNVTLVSLSPYSYFNDVLGLEDVGKF